MQTFRNCYIRVDSSNPLAEQKEAIRATGTMTGKSANTFIEDKNFSALTRLLKTARAGELLVVAELHRLADNIEGLRDTLRKVQKKGLIILVAFTGRRSDKLADWTDEVLETQRYYQRRRLSRTSARKAGRKGGRAR